MLSGTDRSCFLRLTFTNGGMPDLAAYFLSIIVVFIVLRQNVCCNSFGEESGYIYMEQTITAKLQILVNPSDKQILCDTMKAYSDACNYVSEYIYRTHNLSRYSVQEDTYYQVREIYGLRSQMAVSCIRTVIAKYKTILENQKEWIKPVFRLPQLDLVCNRDYSLNSRDDMVLNSILLITANLVRLNLFISTACFSCIYL